MIKTASFAVVHFTVAFTVAYVVTGSWLVGGAIAMIEPMINTVAYHFHESIWKRLERRQPPVSVDPASNGYRHGGRPTAPVSA
jgi:uncharacterized membrane protein